MTLNKALAGALVVQLVILGTLLIAPNQVRPQPASAQQASDKYDGDCTGTETAGRCADKCPADTAQGAYYLQGYDKETGAAVCGFSYFNECPYAAGYSATDPMCAKLADQQATQVNPAQPSEVAQCGGK